MERLDANLAHFAAVLQQTLGVAVADVPGAGWAAGGTRRRCWCWAPTCAPAFEIVTTALGLEAVVAEADLVIVGEGRLDAQSLRGKAPLGVARIARRHGKPVIAIAGGRGRRGGAAGPWGRCLLPAWSAGPALWRRPWPLRRTTCARQRNIAESLRIGGGLSAGRSEADGREPTP